MKPALTNSSPSDPKSSTQASLDYPEDLSMHVFKREQLDPLSLIPIGPYLRPMFAQPRYTTKVSLTMTFGYNPLPSAEHDQFISSHSSILKSAIGQNWSV